MSDTPEPSPPDSPIPEATEPKLRRFQHSLRPLLVVMTLLCLWLAYKTHEAKKQKAVVAWVKEMGGRVNYDYQIDVNGETIPNAQPPVPEFLWKMFGIDFFCGVREVTLSGTQLTDLSPGLAHFKGLANLKKLNLSNTQITDAGLVHLNGFTKLRVLWLNDTQVTDAGLERLKEFAHLEKLNLSNTQITDAGLVHLNGFTKLRKLWLNGTQVTDAGLESFIGLTSLKDLSLKHTQATRAGIETLQKALPDCKIKWDGMDL